MGILTEAGRPDIAKSSGSSQNYQVFTGSEKMVLCQLKPLHNIYYRKNTYIPTMGVGLWMAASWWREKRLLHLQPPAL